MVASGGDDAQCADRAEAVGPAGEVVEGAPQEAAVSDLLFARQIGVARRQDLVAGAAPEGAVGRVDREPTTAARGDPHIGAGASLWTDYPTSFENRRSKCAESAAE